MFFVFFLQTVKFLKNSKLTINKMPSEEFQVTKEVVQRQLLKKVRLSFSSQIISQKSGKCF